MVYAEEGTVPNLKTHCFVYFSEKLLVFEEMFLPRF